MFTADAPQFRRGEAARMGHRVDNHAHRARLRPCAAGALVAAGAPTM
ncbi:MAG: hypothetical protein HY259_00850 [Chloroflexi bacterium]|nr:hypothetical protein [Chloroflexota bacterium]